MRKIISLVLALTILLCSSFIFANAASDGITYNFTGSDKDLAGYAEGTITYTPKTGGTYYLYWADDTKALGGYYEIAKFTLSAHASETFSFSEQVAIPVNATKIIASTVASSDNALVSSAEAVYNIPKTKIIQKDKKDYSFTALSDIHIDYQDWGSGDESYYPNSDENFKKALNLSATHNVDFIVSAGDQVNNSSGSTKEWLTYQKIIADSNYANPIYEAVGNHETRFSSYVDAAPNSDLEEFILGTGLNDGSYAVPVSKTYYEITAKNGDHFLFMSLEEGPTPNKQDNFTKAQLDWLEGKLSSYCNDGHKIFLIQHSLLYGYGAGDDRDDPGYGGAIKMYDEDNQPYVNNQRFKSIIEKTENRNVIWLSGHTHVDFRDEVNYSDENGTSCQMFHIPSCSNTTRIKYNADTGHNELDYTFYDDTTQGYIVDCYDDVCILNGINLYYDKIYPQYTYIEGEYSDSFIYGDVDLNCELEIVDATHIQRCLANMETFTQRQIDRACVDGDTEVNVSQAMLIQKKLARLIEKFPVEETVSSGIVDTGADTTLDKASKYLKYYYQYASYPEYMAIKRAVNINDSSAASTAISKFDILHNRVWADTVYYTDQTTMGEITAYFWRNSSGANSLNWPGHRATYIKTNSFGQKVYAVTVDYKKYDKIIFNNNDKGLQTSDITLDGKSGKGYYPNNTSSPYNVTGYTFEQMWYE